MRTMESKHKRKLFGSLKMLMAIGLIMLVAAPAALAVGTPSGTSISNTATIDYEVLGSNQPDITSAAATFVVDNRVDLTVVSQGNTNVADSQTDAGLEFLVTNLGNTTQGYRFVIVNGAQSITMNNREIWIETNGTSGVQTPGNTTVGPFDTQYTLGEKADNRDLDPNTVTATNAQMTVYIVADAPASPTTGNTDTYWLRAITVDAGGAQATPTDTADTGGVGGIDRPGTVDNVLADADAGGGGDGLNDGQHADSGDFIVVAANLSITKSHTVISDPINSTTNPKAIPGAVIEYTVEITNAAAAAQATLIVLTDDLSTLVTPQAPATQPHMVFDANGYAASEGMRIRVDTGSGYGGWTNVTNTDADTDGDWNLTAGNTVTVDCGTLDATHRVQVQYRLTVRY